MESSKKRGTPGLFDFWKRNMTAIVKRRASIFNSIVPVYLKAFRRRLGEKIETSLCHPVCSQWQMSHDRQNNKLATVTQF